MWPLVNHFWSQNVRDFVKKVIEHLDHFCYDHHFDHGMAQKKCLTILDFCLHDPLINSFVSLFPRYHLS